MELCSNITGSNLNFAVSLSLGLAVRWTENHFSQKRSVVHNELQLLFMLGDGTLFLDQIGQEQTLHLKDVTAYKIGMVELWYEVRKE